MPSTSQTQHDTRDTVTGMRNCGCSVESTSSGDEDSATILCDQRIVYCPTHAAAPLLLEALEEMTSYARKCPPDCPCGAENALLRARHAIRVARGGA